MRIFPVPRTKPQSLIRWDAALLARRSPARSPLSIFDSESAEKSTGFAGAVERYDGLVGSAAKAACRSQLNVVPACDLEALGPIARSLRRLLPAGYFLLAFQLSCGSANGLGARGGIPEGDQCQQPGHREEHRRIRGQAERLAVAQDHPNGGGRDQQGRNPTRPTRGRWPTRDVAAET